MTKLLFDERVPIMAGSDNVGPIEDEMIALVEAGLRPIDALRTATMQPARFLNMKSGVVKAGTAADLVLLENNPLEDIRNTRRSTAVVLRGQYIAVHKDAQNH